MPQQFFDHSTDKAFREKLSGLRVEPRSRVWYRVSAGLDREAALVAHKRRRVVGVLIGVVLLTGIILTAVLDPVATRKKVSNTSGKMPDEKVQLKQKSHSAPATFVNPDLYVDVKIEKQASAINSDNVNLNVVESIFSVSSIQEILVTNENSNSIVDLPLINSFVNFENQNDFASKVENSVKVLTPVVSIDQKVNTTDCNCSNKFYVGAKINLNRTSFADTALAQNTSFIDKFRIQKAFSVYAGYRINRNISAELGWNIFSDEGQSYGYTSLSRKPGAIPTRRDYAISLRYTQIPVKIRYGVECWSGILKTHVNFSLAIGAMYGKLIKSGFTVGDMDVASQLKKSEIAGIGNLSVDIKVFKNLSFATGVEASYSNNILRPDKRLNPFTAPHNLLIGTSVGLKYNFCRK